MKTTPFSIRAFGVIAAICCLFRQLPALAQYQASERPPLLLAQTDPDEAYDPFTDYSEFDEASDEEADVNFFRTGRFFTVGLAGGYRAFTGNFAQNYGSGPTFGLVFTYFFDLRTAFSLALMTGDHSVNFETTQGSYNGTVSLTSINMDFKYYFSTQSIKRTLADLNPYMILGFAQYYRTTTITADISPKDQTMGMEAGLGLEIPLMKKKAFLGVQATYHYVNFSDENKDYLQGTEKLKNRLSGDTYDMLLILGMNY